MNFPGLLTSTSPFAATGTGAAAAGGDTTARLQAQLDEINQLHRDIQRQQELIKQMNQLSTLESTHTQRIIPRSLNESSAEVYQRELSRQAQAELYRLELVQKSMMLEQQMEMYRRSQEEWNKVRDLAIKEEKERRKITEKAKQKWQDEMKTKLTVDEADKAHDVTSTNGVSGSLMDKINKSAQRAQHSSSSSSSQESSTDSSSAVEKRGPSLYEKVAELNKRAVITDEEQKIIEAEILKELHMELSKQAAEKNLMQKPLFFSEMLRNSWSGKQSYKNSDPNQSIEQLTEELSQRIRELNLELAPSKKNSSRRGRSKHAKDGDVPEKRRMGLFKGGTKAKGAIRTSIDSADSHDGREKVDVSSHADADEDNVAFQDENVRDDIKSDEHHKTKKNRHDENFRENVKNDIHHKMKKKLLKALGLRKSKDKIPREPETPKGESLGLIVQAPSKIQDSTEEGESNPSSTPPPSPTASGLVEQVESMIDELPGPPTIGSRASRRLASGATDTSKSMMAPKLPRATSSQSTQLTSNKVYIGVDGDAIEAMSFSSRNRPGSPGSSADLSCESRDRYTSCSGHNGITPSSKRTPGTYTKKPRIGEDPSIFEFLEVQYYPHDELEAPIDEMEADAHKRH